MTSHILDVQHFIYVHAYQNSCLEGFDAKQS